MFPVNRFRVLCVVGSEESYGLMVLISFLVLLLVLLVATNRCVC
jgi:hypothetical protein